MNVFTVRASQVPALDEKLEKLLKKAERLGCKPFAWSYSEVFEASAYVTTQEVVFGTVTSEKTELVHYLATNITISIDESIVLAGWEFIAALSHKGGETIVSGGDKAIATPPEYLQPARAGKCDHCAKSRGRAKTFIVRHTETGEFKQVGSSCIADFLSGHDASSFLSKAAFQLFILNELKEAAAIDSDLRPSWFQRLNLILAHVAVSVRQRGWVSSGVAYDTGKVSTSNHVLDQWDNHVSLVEADDFTRANEAIEWAKSLSDAQCTGDNYLHNIRAIARMNAAGMKTIGLACSILAAHKRVKSQAEQAKQALTLAHVGKVGEKVSLRLTLKKAIECQASQWGQSILYIFIDENGNNISWFSSRRIEAQEGASYTVRGSVKEHSQYKNAPQTILTRCTLTA